MSTVPGLSKTAIMHAAGAFRLGQEAEAHEALVAIIDHLNRQLPAMPPDVLDGLAPILQQTLEAQTRQDAIGVADLLEYELLRNLPATNPTA